MLKIPKTEFVKGTVFRHLLRGVLIIATGDESGPGRIAGRVIGRRISTETIEPSLPIGHESTEWKLSNLQRETIDE